MAAFTFTQVDKVIGTLTNGMKMVSTVVTVTSAGATTATPVYIKPLKRVITFIAGTRTVTAGGIMAWAAGGLNTVRGNPAASANADVFQIISFGY